MARKNQVLTWHSTLCLDCDPPAFTSEADVRRQESWVRLHRHSNPAHAPVAFSHAGYGGEQFAAHDAVTKLITALTEAKIIAWRDTT